MPLGNGTSSIMLKTIYIETELTIDMTTGISQPRAPQTFESAKTNTDTDTKGPNNSNKGIKRQHAIIQLTNRHLPSFDISSVFFFCVFLNEFISISPITNTLTVPNKTGKKPGPVSFIVPTSSCKAEIK